jgi:hypothetical protein
LVGRSYHIAALKRVTPNLRAVLARMERSSSWIGVTYGRRTMFNAAMMSLTAEFEVATPGIVGSPRRGDGWAGHLKPSIRWFQATPANWSVSFLASAAPNPDRAAVNALA